MIAAQQIDPRSLTPDALKALANIRDWKLRRVHGGFTCRGGPKVTLAMVDRLRSLQLVRAGVTPERAIEITGNGRNTLAVAAARKERRT